MDIKPIKKQLYDKIKTLLQTSKIGLVQDINLTMLQTYFEIGKSLAESEQNGDTLDFLSQSLSKEFGRGFSATNLAQMKQFYLCYREKTISDLKLSWSHYLLLMRINNEKERAFYEIEAANNQWAVKELKRQCDSALYEHLVLSRDSSRVKELSEKGLVIATP